ncbi:unnamed protein product [Nesidiocoris tenuis]|uniref:WSC domain-containing protein n=1 Tax=Nesidiocoris tenuis TaxID=355587 RepID=A0A6H5GN81_9HEMI|nr:unnamed protein product [Nesidiocoris tenuis]
MFKKFCNQKTNKIERMIPNLPRYYFQAVLTKSGIIKLVPCKFLYTRIWNRMRSRSQRWIRWSLGFPGIKLNPAVQSRLWASLKYDSCTYFHSGQLLNYGSDGLKYLACFKENSITDRLLKGAQEEFRQSLSPDICMSFCKTKGMRYFGLEYSFECFCSNERPSLKNTADEDECDMKCEGNPRETCGGALRISVYDSEEDLSNVRYIGCYKEKSAQARLMTGAQKDFQGSLTNQKCIDYCKERHFSYAATQFKYQCFCSNERPHFKSSAEEDECNQPCDGNSEETCGGGYRLSVYDLYDQSEEGKLLGCFEDNGNLRVLSGLQITFKETNTPRLCLNVCLQLGFKFAGVQYGPTTTVTTRRSTVTTRRTTSTETVRPASKPKPKPVTSKPTYRPNLGSDKLNQTKNPSAASRPGQTSATRRPQTQQFGTAKPQTNPWLSNQGTTTPNPWVNQGAQTTTPQPQNPWVSNQGTQTNFNEDNTSNKKPGYNPQQQQRPTGNNQQAENQYQQGGSALQGENPWQQENNQYQSGLITNQQISGSNNQQKPNTPPTDFETLGAADRTTSKPTCVRSVTEVKGENVCRGQVLFHDDFSEGSRINKYKWTHEVIMPWTPDYEFVVYQKSNKNSFLRNQKLFIKPTLLNDDFVKRGLLELERQLEVGILMGVDENIRARTIIRDKVDGWWRSFHNYTLIWTPGEYLTNFSDEMNEQSMELKKIPERGPRPHQLD